MNGKESTVMTPAYFKRLIKYNTVKFRYVSDPQERAAGLQDFELEAKEGFFDVMLRKAGEKQFVTKVYGNSQRIKYYGSSSF